MDARSVGVKWRDTERSPDDSRERANKVSLSQSTFSKEGHRQVSHDRATNERHDPYCSVVNNRLTAP
jgi:hypothetical protein